MSPLKVPCVKWPRIITLLYPLYARLLLSSLLHRQASQHDCSPILLAMYCRAARRHVRSREAAVWMAIRPECMRYTAGRISSTDPLHLTSPVLHLFLCLTGTAFRHLISSSSKAGLRFIARRSRTRPSCANELEATPLLCKRVTK